MRQDLDLFLTRKRAEAQHQRRVLEDNQIVEGNASAREKTATAHVKGAHYTVQELAALVEPWSG